MGRSQETFNKKEREKIKQKKRREKEEKKQQRKASGKSSSFEDMIAYVDEFGRITSTPPDKAKQEVKAEDIPLGVQHREEIPVDPTRKGKISYYNASKGYGFIRDNETKESIFVHMNAMTGQLGENDNVTFEVENTPKGKRALNVRKAA